MEKTKNIKISNRIIKKNAKASVFTHLFNISKYRKELYVSLHPKDKNIKREYLIEKRKEVYNIMISVYDQKTATDMYGREQYAEGIERGKSDSILFALKKNYITIENAASVLNISKAKLEQMMKE